MEIGKVYRNVFNLSNNAILLKIETRFFTGKNNKPIKKEFCLLEIDGHQEWWPLNSFKFNFTELKGYKKRQEQLKGEVWDAVDKGNV